MATSEEAIKKKIKEHIDKEGSGYPAWYAGISNDAERRLFDEHGVPREKGKAWYIWDTASSNAVARRVEQYLIGLGCDGAAGGGEEDANMVYAYKKTASTDP